jgi:DNA-binding NtrC family response regulator
VERWFEAARHGTLFLDEIAELPPTLQLELLRLVQESEATRASLSDPETVEVRLVVASRSDLSEVVATGQFRLDLFYRLSVGQVRLLPLRERRGDISPLARHFLRIHAQRLGRPVPAISADALSVLTQHSWPGNVRELENVIRFALLLGSGTELLPQHLHLSSLPAATTAPPATVRTDTADAGPQTLSRFLLQMFQTPGPRLLSGLESQVVAEAFNFTGRNQVNTAALLGISRNVLRTLLRRHGLLAVRRRKARGEPTPMK